MQELNLNCRQVVDAIKSRKKTARDIAGAYIEQIEKVNPSINALVQYNIASIFKQADTIDQSIDHLKDKRLLGVPVTIKNTAHVIGFQPDKGCKNLMGNRSMFDASIVSRLRNEGAIIFGLTNTPELSIGYETDNLLYGQTKNPYDLNRSPGGSSGGESAAIASQCSLLGIGTDASGSLRVPAHCTGIATIKYTQGRIPLTGHYPMDNMGLFSQFISFGPLARSVEDLCYISPIIVGPDEIDPHAVPVIWKDPDLVDLNKLNVAYYDSDPVAPASNDIANVVKVAVGTLSKFVASVINDRPDALDNIGVLLSKSILLGGDKGKWLENIITKINLTEPSPLLLEFLHLAKKSEFSVTELRESWMKLDQFRKEILKFFQRYDAIICPVAATTAKYHGKSYQEIEDFSYSMTYSLVSTPVVVVRCGMDGIGLPIGIQIITKPWREDIGLAIAKCLERNLGGWISPYPLTRELKGGQYD